MESFIDCISLNSDFGALEQADISSVQQVNIRESNFFDAEMMPDELLIRKESGIFSTLNFELRPRFRIEASISN